MFEVVYISRTGGICVFWSAVLGCLALEFEGIYFVVELLFRGKIFASCKGFLECYCGIFSEDV